MAPLPSGLVTFCFTDIEASTQLNQHLGECFGALIAKHDALIRRAVSDRDGVVIKSLGDGLFLAFADPRQAVLACRDAQRALTSHSWPGGVTVRVRMACTRARRFRRVVTTPPWRSIRRSACLPLLMGGRSC